MSRFIYFYCALFAASRTPRNSQERKKRRQAFSQMIYSAQLSNSMPLYLSLPCCLSRSRFYALLQFQFIYEQCILYISLVHTEMYKKYEYKFLLFII